METIKIYIDGSCYNNGNFNKSKPANPFGGWAMICVKNNETFFQDSGGELFTTNNKMEMMAMKKALEYVLKQENSENQYEIYSDSEYVVLSSLFYTKKWVKNDWMRITDQGKVPIKNKDMWVSIYELLHKIIPANNKKVTIHKVKAHSDATDMSTVYNNLVDSLAKKAAENHRNKNYAEWEKGPQQQVSLQEQPQIQIQQPQIQPQITITDIPTINTI